MTKMFCSPDCQEVEWHLHFWNLCCPLWPLWPTQRSEVKIICSELRVWPQEALHTFPKRAVWITWVARWQRKGPISWTLHPKQANPQQGNRQTPEWPRVKALGPQLPTGWLQTCEGAQVSRTIQPTWRFLSKTTNGGLSHSTLGLPVI